MRFNILGGPGAGKSTTAAGIFAHFKRKGASIELIPEYVKGWVYMNHLPQKFDQIYLFGKQLRAEDKVLNARGHSKVKNVVSDSPIYLGHIYARMFSGIAGLSEHLLGLADLYNASYPSVAIYLDRGTKAFVTEGRWGDLDSAREVDKEVLKFVQERYKDNPEDLLIADYLDTDSIYKFVDRHIDK